VPRHQFAGHRLVVQPELQQQSALLPIFLVSMRLHSKPFASTTFASATYSLSLSASRACGLQ